MNNIYLYLSLLFFLISTPAIGQNIRVRVVAAVSREHLPYATVSLNDQNAFYTDEDGYFSFPLVDPSDSLQIAYVGYQTARLRAGDLALDRLNMVIMYSQSDLPTVEVTTPRAVFNRSLSIMSPELEALERVPLLAGESDPLKALQLLPGVSGSTEGSAGLSIRGGNVSQTHLIVDGNAIYNANHIGGFLSSLPSFGIKRIDVYKGGMPARFGGRLSGVVDVQLRDGRRDGDRHEFVVGTGLMRAGTEGPLGKKWTYLATGRIAYPNLIDRLITSGGVEKGVRGSQEVFSMQDAVGKLTYRSDRFQTSTSVFASGDNGFGQNDLRQNRFFFDEFNWSNFSLAQQFRFDLQPALILKGALQYNRYAYNYQNKEVRSDPTRQRVNTGSIGARLNDPGARLRLDYQPSPKFFISGGVHVLGHDFRHRQSERIETRAVNRDTLDLSQRSVELSSFAQIRADLFDRHLTIDAGIRNSRLLNSRFNYLEPRIRLGYNFGPAFSLNAGLDYSTQYLHQVAADVTIFPNDLWLIASNTYQPSRSRQFFVGAATYIKRWNTSFSVEAYTKEMTGLTEANPFKSNAETGPANFLSNLISNGRGRTRGVEFYVERQSEKLSLSVSYTLAASERKYASLNEGQWFPFTFDRRHDIAINAGYQLARGWYFTGTFVYQSGRTVTVPVLTSPLFNVFGTVNNGRFPPFHRLNLGFEKKWSGHKHKNHQHSLTLSVYNAYNRANPYDVFFFPSTATQIDPVTGEQIVRSTVDVGTRGLFPFIPGISYKRTIK